MHCMLPESQYPEVEAFIDKFLLGKTDVDTFVSKADMFEDMDYLKSNVDENAYGSLSDNGFVVGLTYKGAKAAKAGTYGVYAKYYDQRLHTRCYHLDYQVCQHHQL